MRAGFVTECIAICGKAARIAAERTLDAAFPPSARMQRVRAYAPESIAASPAAHDLCGRRIITLARYHQKPMEDAIRALKYERDTRAARLLAQLLAEYLAEELPERAALSDGITLLVPVPLAPGRERERGYNQIELVLRELPALGIDAAASSRLLERTRETRAQTHLSRRERLQNVAGAFSARDDALIRGASVILIDDVATTGATLDAAARALERAGCSVTALAFARA